MLGYWFCMGTIVIYECVFIIFYVFVNIRHKKTYFIELITNELHNTYYFLICYSLNFYFLFQ